MKNFLETVETAIALIRMTPMRALLIGNSLLVSALIILSNLHVLPLRLWDFIFFTLLFFLVALYRSGFIFALLIGVLPLEIINLAPAELGINLRPYQFLAVLLLAALGVRLLMRKISWPLFEIRFPDVIMGLFLLSSCAVIPFLPFLELMPVAVKQVLILLSFGLIYFLGRIFLKKESDIRIALPFFLSSVCIVLLYSLWQSIRFKMGLPDFEVMAGRPNGTLPEADFLGGFLAMILSGMIPFGLSFFFQERVSCLKKTGFALFLFLLFLILILTMARSGWLAAVTGMIIGGMLFYSRYGLFQALRTWDKDILWKGVRGKVFIGLPLAAALSVIIFFQLTSFDVFDRGTSLSSGLQKITISCDTDVAPPERIARIELLPSYGCRHIDLEAIEDERAAGHVVTEIFRDDPNISIRKNIYMESWSLIKAHPATGIGFGNVSHFFGIDGRGAGLNASNVFLEVWLGAGLVGFIAFMVFWFSFPIALMKNIFQAPDRKDSVMAIGLSAAWIAITVFNCFNSGLLIGTMWIFFSILVWAEKK